MVCPEEPKPGLWYCLESSNTHTSAHHFFRDTVHRSHFGNRLHPFPKSPVIFIYRNPLDIVVSEANYYHEDGKTAFSGYLNHLCFEERLIRLIDDPWLLGTIMDRVAKFAAWLDFQNVVPVSFEELVGHEGGGSRKVQRKLIGLCSSSFRFRAILRNLVKGYSISGVPPLLTDGSDLTKLSLLPARERSLCPYHRM